MTDCKSPNCHEEIQISLHKRVPKAWLWAGLVAMVPIFLFGLNSWNNAKEIRAENKASIQVVSQRQDGFDKALESVIELQREMRTDIKSILRAVK